MLAAYTVRNLSFTKDIWQHAGLAMLAPLRLRSDPEYKVKFDGKETYVMCNDVKLAMRRNDGWVSVEPGVTVRDIVENGRNGIEVEYRRVTVH